MFIRRVTRGQLLILLVVLAVNVCAVSAQMRVHFLDVGQAESILLQTDEYTL